MKIRSLVITLCAIATCTGTLSAQEKPDKGAAIAGEAAAIQRATRLTGLDAFSSKTSAQLRDAAREDNPFAWADFAGGKVWSVKFGPGRARLKEASARKQDEFSGTFEVVLEQKTGRLVCVKARADDASGAEKKNAPIEDATQGVTQMKNMGQRINGLADHDPKWNFLDALERSGAYIYSTKRMDAWCVDFTNAGGRHPCAWYFTFASVPMYFPMPPQVPKIDANTAGYTPVTPVGFTPAKSTPKGIVPADCHSQVDGMNGGVLGNDEIEVVPGKDAGDGGKK